MDVRVQIGGLGVATPSGARVRADLGPPIAPNYRGRGEGCGALATGSPTRPDRGEGAAYSGGVVKCHLSVTAVGGGGPGLVSLCFVHIVHVDCFTWCAGSMMVSLRFRRCPKVEGGSHNARRPSSFNGTRQSCLGICRAVSFIAASVTVQLQRANMAVAGRSILHHACKIAVPRCRRCSAVAWSSRVPMLCRRAVCVTTRCTSVVTCGCSSCRWVHSAYATSSPLLRTMRVRRWSIASWIAAAGRKPRELLSRRRSCSIAG